MGEAEIDPLILECLPEDIGSSDSLVMRGTTLTGESKSSSPLFAKTSSNVKQLIGEHTSLRAMRITNPDLVPAIYPLSFNKDSSKAGMVTDKFDFGRVGSSEKQRALGLALAKMHRTFAEVDTVVDDEDLRPRGFGFPVPTHCGVTEQDNEWMGTWEEFFRDKRLGSIINRLDDPQVNQAWKRLQDKAIPLLLSIQPPPKPVILHGDLWSGNVGWADFKPIIFDPSSYYGHNEAELGITHMFGGFTQDFYEAYHSVHPRCEPYYDERMKLYELYHHLNHALMFGGSYTSGALRIIGDLVDWAETVK